MENVGEDWSLSDPRDTDPEGNYFKLNPPWHSTDLLLAHLTETWRRALDSNLVVGVIFIDFQKAFDSISHKNLIYKLEHYYGIKGNLLAWTGDYLSKRKQYTIVNGELSVLILV